jgi:hypothetical protein
LGGGDAVAGIPRDDGVVALTRSLCACVACEKNWQSVNAPRIVDPGGVIPTHEGTDDDEQSSELDAGEHVFNEYD